MTQIKVIVPKGLLFYPDKILRAVENSLDGASEGARIDFEATVDTWDSKPKFYIARSRLSRFIFTDNTIYSYVNDGTRPHIIQPKNPDGSLFFFGKGFRAKTRVMALRSNKGAKATKDPVKTQIVHHPGTEARKFDVAVEKKWSKQLKIILQRTLDAEFIRQIKTNP